MRDFLWIVAFWPLFADPFGFGQTVNKGGWGPWRYTDFKVTAVEFRSKCVSSSDGDSKWAYQFRSRVDLTVDFGERVEHGVDGVSKNELGQTKRLTLDEREIGPVFETQIHGTCAEVKELKIEVMCVTDPGAGGPCYADAGEGRVDLDLGPKPARFQ